MTERLIIDLALERAGWQLSNERDREYKVTGMPNAEGVGYADYVLWGDDDKLDQIETVLDEVGGSGGHRGDRHGVEDAAVDEQPALELDRAEETGPEAAGTMEDLSVDVLRCVARSDADIGAFFGVSDSSADPSSA